jgi:response regulator RpfG family c-di-GMP phosphodiesterase/tRNA A-37 threonylcarbamoyl transferase component Bud32
MTRTSVEAKGNRTSCGQGLTVLGAETRRQIAPGSPANRPDLPPASQHFLEQLLEIQLLSPSLAEGFLEQTGERLAEFTSAESLGHALVRAGLLTTYQLDRMLAGTTHGLVLGNHRVLERLGTGAMAVVFLAEHALLKRRVALKVMPVDEDCPAALLQRFYAEMRVLADLHHPNIVMAFDAGKLAPPRAGMPALLYLVMELVDGGDLERYVLDHGPVPILQACDWIRQAACGLQEAHDHHLVHRDVKPSNLLFTKRGQIKVVDFGLARQFSSRLTDPRALLGTLDYMAPEQSHDATAVSPEADIFGLGATLFWLLTGETPYAPTQNLAEAVRQLQRSRPRRLRELQPDAPAELEALLDRMMDPDPACRPSQPLAVMNALLPFTAPLEEWACRRSLPGGGAKDAQAPPRTPTGQAESASVRPASDQPKDSVEVGWELLAGWNEGSHEGKRLAVPLPGPARGMSPPVARRILIVDDEVPFRRVSRSVLEPLGLECAELEDAETALVALRQQPYDLVLLDLNLPGMDGYELCRQLRERPPRAHFKIIIVSGRGDPNQLAEALPRGADDYIAKPFELCQLTAKVLHALQLQEAQERADLLSEQLLLTNRQLENGLAARSRDVRQAQDALLFAMAKLAELRDGETPGHLRRLQQYSRCLADGIASEPSWEGVLTQSFLEQLERCVPLHDIGKIGLPDEILRKPGLLTGAERVLVATHPIIGDHILQALGEAHGESLSFLGMASAIVRHHHERYDGTGYPDGLAGDAIPPAARLVALADVYDALRRQRFHKPALSHADAVRILLEASPGQFDPALLGVFRTCADSFARIYRDIPT